MFDPTVFENLKVGFENHVYDLDNLTGQLSIINRKDLLDLAVMNREFGIEFILNGVSSVSAEIILKASLKELASEILEVSGENPGCELTLRYRLKVNDIDGQCEKINQVIERIWKPTVKPSQTIQYQFGQRENCVLNTIDLTFDHKINEDHMGDIPNVVDHVISTLEELDNIME